MAPSNAPFGPLRPCNATDCPLTQVGINHSVGIYKHEGKEPGARTSFRDFIFKSLNPPPFVKEASELLWKIKAIRAQAEASGDLKTFNDLKDQEWKYGGIISRYANHHVGYSCTSICGEHGGRSHPH